MQQAQEGKPHGKQSENVGWSPFPPEVERWNWGAFFFTWIWGLAHNTPIALLSLVPCVGFVMPFVLGARGGRWAWQNKRWSGIDEFVAAQRRWAKAALVAVVAMVGLLACTVVVVSHVLKNHEVTVSALEDLRADGEALRVLGEPLATGFVQGSFQTSGPSGKAELSIPVEGPNGEGTLYVHAEKAMGRWQIEALELEVDGRSGRMQIRPRRLDTR